MRHHRGIDVTAGNAIDTAARTAWNIAARHLAVGQKDPVKMLVEAIVEELERCIELLVAAGVKAAFPIYIADPDYDR